MVSKTCVAYVLMALAAAPSLMANPISPGDIAVNATLPPITVNAGHSTVPPSSSAAPGNTSATSPAPPSDKPAAINATTSTNATGAAHPPATPPSNPASSGNATGAPHPPATPPSTPASSGNATSAPHPPATTPATPASSGNNTKALNATDAAHSPAPPSNLTSAPAPPLNRSGAANTTLATNASSTAGAHPPSPGNNDHGATPKGAPTAAPTPELPMIPSCFSKKKSNGVEDHHCEKALDKVVYAANQTLDKFSGLVFANYKTCNINIYKPKNVTLTKKQVSSMVHNITDACHSVGGTLFKTSKIAVKVERGKAENTYDLENSSCEKQECPLTQGDCFSAFYQIPFSDHKGKNGTKSFSRVTSGNCTVTISTTDYSKLDISRANVYPIMKKLFNDCGRHPGKIYLPGGSVGLNGDLKISTRAANHEFCD